MPLVMSLIFGISGTLIGVLSVASTMGLQSRHIPMSRIDRCRLLSSLDWFVVTISYIPMTLHQFKIQATFGLFCLTQLQSSKLN